MRLTSADRTLVSVWCKVQILGVSDEGVFKELSGKCDQSQYVKCSLYVPAPLPGSSPTFVCLRPLGADFMVQVYLHKHGAAATIVRLRPYASVYVRLNPSHFGGIGEDTFGRLGIERNLRNRNLLALTDAPTSLRDPCWRKQIHA